VVESPDLAHGWRRLDGVDILRGLAIIFVLMNHVNMRLIIAKLLYAEGLRPIGVLIGIEWQYGVQMPFAVSGFLITSTSDGPMQLGSVISAKSSCAQRRRVDLRSVLPETILPVAAN
jgi:peptidoglycan/LPS O-acetylase OafA/YrhL